MVLNTLRIGSGQPNVILSKFTFQTLITSFLDLKLTIISNFERNAAIDFRYYLHQSITRSVGTNPRNRLSLKLAFQIGRIKSIPEYSGVCKIIAKQMIIKTEYYILF